MSHARTAFSVVPDEEEAQSVKDFAVTFKFLDKKAAQSLKLLEVDPTDQDALAAALTRSVADQHLRDKASLLQQRVGSSRACCGWLMSELRARVRARRCVVVTAACQLATQGTAA